MTGLVCLRTRAQEYLRGQRNLGFHLVSSERYILNFANFVENIKPFETVTSELTSQWAREVHGGNASPEASSRRLAKLRPF